MDFTNMAVGLIIFMVAISIAVIFGFIVFISAIITKGKEFAKNFTDSAKRETANILNQQLFEERLAEENLINQHIKKSLHKVSQIIDREDLTKKLGIDDSLGIEVENVDGVEKYHELLVNDVRYNLSLEERQQTPELLQDIANSTEGWEGNILDNIANHKGKNFTMRVKNGDISSKDKAQGYVSQNEYNNAVSQIFSNEEISTLNSMGEVTKTQNIGEATIFITTRKADEINPAIIIFGWMPKKVYVETSTGRVVATEKLDEEFSQFSTGFGEFEVDLGEYGVDFSEIERETNTLGNK